MVSKMPKPQNRHKTPQTTPTRPGGRHNRIIIRSSGTYLFLLMWQVDPVQNVIVKTPSMVDPVQNVRIWNLQRWIRSKMLMWQVDPVQNVIVAAE
jgi:hypothetical protein